MRLLPAGSDAVLLEADDLAASLALHASLSSDPLDGVVELVPAARTVLVRYQPWVTSPERIGEQVRARTLVSGVPADGPLVVVPVHYDGEDLPEVAQRCGLSETEVVRAHTAVTHRVAFTGFAPGFAYLSGGDPRLQVPRRPVPRTRIGAGAVGLAGEFSGVYPRASPGGWQVIGRTDVAMWDLRREVPALLRPGMRVRFADADNAADTDNAADADVDADAAGPLPPLRDQGPTRVYAGGPALEVLSPGALSLLEDLGRPGRSSLGLSRSGAMDRGALRRANRLVGNASGAPALEVAGGLRVLVRGALVLAVEGAPAPVTVTGPGGARTERAGAAFAVEDGEEVALGPPRRGVRCYLAVRGAFAADVVLGSASGDVLAGIGAAPLRAGDVLPVAVGPASAVVSAVALDAFGPPPPPAAGDVTTLDVVLGPRADWFTPGALDRLRAQEWEVTAQSNRVGLRLRGPHPLERATHAELPSEGAVAGALQVPPSGQPVLLMADHPVTGGYPVIACVAAHHLDAAAQVPPGGRLRFRTAPGDG